MASRGTALHRSLCGRVTARCVAIFSGVVFGTALVLHLSTFLPSPFVRMGYVWPIHLAIFPPFGAFIWAISRGKNRQGLSEAWEVLPKWSRVLGAILFAYTAINFLVFLGLMEGASLGERHGICVLEDHGDLVRTLSEKECQRFRAYEVRGLSGHWMFFSFVPFAYFAAVWRRSKTGDATPKPVTPEGHSPRGRLSTRWKVAATIIGFVIVATMAAFMLLINSPRTEYRGWILARVLAVGMSGSGASNAISSDRRPWIVVLALTAFTVLALTWVVVSGSPLAFVFPVLAAVLWALYGRARRGPPVTPPQ